MVEHIQSSNDTPTPLANDTHIAQLDGWRGISILCILAAYILPRQLYRPVLHYLAKISYALSVIHGFTVNGWFNSGGTVVKYLVKRPIGIVLVFSLAHASTFYWEFRLTALGKRLSRVKRPAGDGDVAFERHQVDRFLVGVNLVSATEPDASRELCHWGRWEPSRRLLQSIRRYQHWRQRGDVVGRAIAALCLVRYRFWSIVTGAEIPLNTNIAVGLLLPHPNGVVIHPDTWIGPNGLIFQQVTLGTGGPIPGVPRVGGHVDIGAGAKILGGVVIGDHAKIGANAVVLGHVPAGTTAVGIPARIISARSIGNELELISTTPPSK